MFRSRSFLAGVLLIAAAARAGQAPKDDSTSPEVIRSLMKKCFEYQVADQAKKKADGGWVRAAFYTGVLAAYDATRDETYLKQAVDWAENQGHWAPNQGDWRFADHYCNAQVYCELYRLTHDPKMIQTSRANFDRILAAPKPGRSDWWWCDSLFMAPPGFARMSAVTGDPRYVDYMDKSYWDATDFLYSPEHHLFFRDKSFFPPKATENGGPIFWSRGNGWVVAGLARVIPYLPEGYPTRGKYVGLLRDMSAKLISVQGKDGAWRPSLLDAGEFPTPETSGTAFFTFAMAWGINNNVLDRQTYLPHVLHGWAALCSLLTDDGKLTRVQRVAGAPGKVNPGDTHEYAGGGFLLAGAEMLKLNPTADERAAAFNDFTPPPLVAVGEASPEVAPAAAPPQPKRRPLKSTWPTALPADGIAPYVDQFRKDLAAAPVIRPTGLTRADYLKLIASNVDFWKQHQNSGGAIIDPYKKVEWQYSTPCFALACASLIAHAQRTDLLEPACLAMDHATRALHDRKAATAHEDFYAPTLAHALLLLKPYAPPERYATWAENIRTFDPFKTYRAGVGTSNWNVVASSGEALFHLMGLRPDPAFTEASYAGQGHTFINRFGLYTEGPMPYDHFPRLWAADAVVGAGYKGKSTEMLAEQLRRAALTSLFMESPTGELPTGGRSSQHQWNEAEQCVTYEIFANYYHKKGDEQLAQVFKRAAHLALGSIQRWVRPSGELQILKNRVDPAELFGYEGYSAHSQYNLLTMGMLAIAFERAEPTEQLTELAAPADVGGFVLDLRDVLHKVFANAAGTYFEIDTGADPHYNATGLIRVHRSGVNPQIGPSDALTATPASRYPKDLPHTTAAVGVAWKLADGSWQSLAQFPGTQFAHEADKFAPRPAITAVDLADVSASPDSVSFILTYHAPFQGPTSVVEHYAVTPGNVQLSADLPGYSGQVAMTFPALANDGRDATRIDAQKNALTVSFAGSAETATAPAADSLSIPETTFPSRNGLFRLATFTFPAGNQASLTLEPGQK